MNTITPFLAQLSDHDSNLLDAVGIGTLIVISLITSVVTGLIGVLIGSSRNRKSAGLFLGITLGPIGWVITLFLSVGDRDENLLDGIGAYILAMFITVLIQVTAWKWSVRPLLDRAILDSRQAETERKKRYDATMASYKADAQASEAEMTAQRQQAAVAEKTRQALYDQARTAPRRLLAGLMVGLCDREHVLVSGGDLDPYTRFGTQTSYVLAYYPGVARLSEQDPIDCIAARVGDFEYEDEDGVKRRVPNYVYLAARIQDAPAQAKTVAPTKTAEQTRAEILRKYGGK
jgi:hypothetical protein